MSTRSAGLIGPALDQAAGLAKTPRLLLTAHGLPKKIVNAGDPYPRQVEMTARAVVAALGRPGLDWLVCYQSRVGPLEWLGPATDAEIRRAGAEGVPLVVAPISFVSEHSETLVELDLDYRRLADESGVPAYQRVATVGTEPGFIAALAALVRGAVAAPNAVECTAVSRRCLSPRSECRRERLARGRLSMDQVGAYPRRHRLDGGAAVSAAALRLPRDGAGMSRRSATFKIMERRLLRGIMNPAMVAALVFGVLLAGAPGVVDWHRGWIWAKLVLVAALVVYHGALALWRRAFADDRNRHSPRFFRIVNELPTLALIAIVVLVVVKPF